MYQKLFLSFCFVMAAVFLPAGVHAAAEPTVSAQAAVVIHADTGEILYAKSEHERLPMASTTKIMTALLTLEAAEDDNREITITPEMVRVAGSSMGLRAGDRLTLKDLAEGMLLVSGNDAANSAAIAVGGSIDGFAVLMNQKAAQLGLKDTHYVTPSGLDSDEHYSSAYDLAILSAAAMQNEEFAAIAGQKTMRIHFLEPDETRTYSNHNRLLSMYPYCTGVKTGYTMKSGRCLVSSAQKGNARLIAVTLNDPDDWDDHEALLDYGFSQLSEIPVDDSDCSIFVPVTGGAAGSVTVSGTAGENIVLSTAQAQTMKRTIELPQFVYAPVESGQVLGCVRYTVDGETIETTELTAAHAVGLSPSKRSFLQWIWDGIRRFFTFR